MKTLNFSIFNVNMPKITIFRCLSEGVFLLQYVLKFKNVWISSKRGSQHFSNSSEIQSWAMPYLDLNWIKLNWIRLNWIWLLKLTGQEWSWVFRNDQVLVLIIPDQSWSFLTILDHFWKVLIIPDRSWLFLTSLIPFWPLLIIPDQSWSFLIILDCFWPLLTSPDHSCPVLTIFDQPW